MARKTPVKIEEPDYGRPIEHHCVACKKTAKTEKTLRAYFYTTNSRFHTFKRTHLCKQCILDHCVNDIGKVELTKLKDVLREINRPFLFDLWESANEKKPDSPLGEYFKNITSLPQYKELTWDNSIFGEVAYKMEDVAIDFFEMESVWGSGYTNAEYKFLNDAYRNWTTRYKCTEYGEEVLFKEMTYMQLDIKRDRENGRDVIKKNEALQKLMKSANVQPADSVAANSDENKNAYGVWVRDIEKYRPAEYWQDKKKYFDYFGLREYMERFVLRPLKNLLTGSRDFDKEYSIKDDD